MGPRPGITSLATTGLLLYALVCVSLCPNVHVKAQTADSMVALLHAINQRVDSAACGSKHTQLISNRAMNVLMADKTGYLSTFGDLSYYTNYVTYQSAEGILTINHNYQTPKGTDALLRRLFATGVKVNAMDALLAQVHRRAFYPQWDVTLSHTWLGKVVTRLPGCSNGMPPQVTLMHGLRSALVQMLTSGLKAYDSVLLATLPATGSYQPLANEQATGNALARNYLLQQAAENAAMQYATQQATMLTNTAAFGTITHHWTTLLAGLPLAFPRYAVAPAVSAPLTHRRPYNAYLAISHTRMWETSKWGRLFITAFGDVVLDNTAAAGLMERTQRSSNRPLGGTDTIGLATLQHHEVFIGPYRRMLTPSLSGRIVYFFPGNAHVGLSLLARQYIGRARHLFVRAGIPIVFINRQRLPALNIEVQLNVYDVTRRLPATAFPGRSSIGVNVGLPLSRLMY